jgi:hypothetical protein
VRVYGAAVGGVRGVGSVRGAIIVRETSPLIRLLEANASTLVKPSPCLFGWQIEQGDWETSVHVDGLLSPSRGKCYTC